VRNSRRPGTNNAIRAIKLGLISVIAGGLLISTPHAAAATSGGVKITLNCQTGNSGLGTFKVTANGSTSTVTVQCGGSATVTNPSWMSGATATIDETAGPVGTRLVTNGTVSLAPYVVNFFTSVLPCYPGVTTPGCPATSRAYRRESIPWWLVAVILGSFLLSILGVILAQVWMVGQRIRYFHRLYFDKPEAFREAMRSLALVPGMAWQIRLRSKLLRVPLPDGFEDAERVIREDRQRL
jgi:hypothetical protein